MDSALIIGADSTIGRELANRLSEQGVDVYRTTRNPDRVGHATSFLDLRDFDASFRDLPDTDVTFVMASLTGVDMTRREDAERVNVHATSVLFEHLAGRGTHIVFPSTTLVLPAEKRFEGPETTPRPITAYGVMKAQAEQALARTRASWTTIRLSKVFAANNRLLDTWRNKLLSGEMVEAFEGVSLAPISVACAAHVLAELAARRAAGIFHFSSSEEVDYADIARLMASRLGAMPDRVRGVTPPPGASPHLSQARHSALDCSATSNLTGIEPPPFGSAVDYFCGTLEHAVPDTKARTLPAV